MERLFQQAEVECRTWELTSTPVQPGEFGLWVNKCVQLASNPSLPPRSQLASNPHAPCAVGLHSHTARSINSFSGRTFRTKFSDVDAKQAFLDTLLTDALDVLGDRKAAVCIELTKMYEETARGWLGDLAGRFAEETPRGEVTLVIAGNNRKFLHPQGGEPS